MKNRAFLTILSISLLVIAVLSYFAFFDMDIFFNGVKKDEIEVFNKYVDKNISVCYGNKYKCNKINYNVKGKVDENKIGEYKLTYVANYKKKSKTFTKSVKVVDKTPPTIEISGSFDKVCPNGKVNDLVIKATDNYDGDLTSKVESNTQDNKIIYRVMDSSSNKTEKEVDIIVKDDTAPSLILNGDKTVYLGVGSKFIESGYVSIDECDGTLTENVTVTGGVDTSKSGTYTVTYQVKDSSGNESVAKRTVRVYEKNNNPSISNSSGSVIYLTFDDGPGAHTARLLDILAKYNVKATFFVVGYTNNHNDMITREYNEGHTVALHSYTHDYAKIYVSSEAFYDDLFKVRDKVKQYTGVEATIMRFPGGSSNTVSRRYKNGIMSELTKSVENIGFRYFDWTISSGDAGNTTSTEKVYQNVISSLKPNQANVILQHDTKGFSVDAVERIIQYGLANGYTFAPLTMDSPVIHQHVNN